MSGLEWCRHDLIKGFELRVQHQAFGYFYIYYLFVIYLLYVYIKYMYTYCN